MNEERKKHIAASFPENYAETNLNIVLTETEFASFLVGIYAKSTNEKWNIFAIKEYMYWSRSWTNHCIYKIRYENKSSNFHLNTLQVSRKSSEYNSQDLDHDVRIFKRMLSFYLKNYS